MITIGLDTYIVCQLCDGEVRLDTQRIVGCLCDPDAPTWIGIEPNGRVLAFSQSKYEIIREPQKDDERAVWMHTYD